MSRVRKSADKVRDFQAQASGHLRCRKISLANGYIVLSSATVALCGSFLDPLLLCDRPAIWHYAVILTQLRGKTDSEV